MTPLTLDTSLLAPTVTPAQIDQLSDQLATTHRHLLDGTCPGADFLGWRDWPDQDHHQLLDAIQQAASRIQQQSQALVVIGIGGSHLAGQAGLEFIHGSYHAPHVNGLPVYFVGHNLSSRAWLEIAARLRHQDWSLNVISKSGTTLEPGLAFAYFRSLLEKRYGAAARERIYATTDAHTGLLHDQAVGAGWSRFIVPDDIGGRYSGLTSVGLLPWAVAGLDIAAALQGASKAKNDLLSNLNLTNPAWQYAASRYLLCRAGKTLELFATYEPSLQLLGRWWQQLFGESEGKTNPVIFPATINYTQDLHSLGQFLQQGSKNMFETTFYLDEDATIPLTSSDVHHTWPYLDGKNLDFVQKQAHLATLQAHHQGGVPQLVFHLTQTSEFTLGYTLYFFEYACALSALLLGVNPFDQPGVQAYKEEMMRRLQE